MRRRRRIRKNWKKKQKNAWGNGYQRHKYYYRKRNRTFLEERIGGSHRKNGRIKDPKGVLNLKFLQQMIGRKTKKKMGGGCLEECFTDHRHTSLEEMRWD
jgi:hypothetical protein